MLPGVSQAGDLRIRGRAIGHDLAGRDDLGAEVCAVIRRHTANMAVEERRRVQVPAREILDLLIV